MTKFAGVFRVRCLKNRWCVWVSMCCVVQCNRLCGYHRRVGVALVPSGVGLFCAAALACVLPCLARAPRAVLQGAHAARRLAGSYHSPPQLIGVMWSTVVAWRVHPGRLTWQVWLSRSSICRRMRCHGPLYTGCALRYRPDLMGHLGVGCSCIVSLFRSIRSIRCRNSCRRLVVGLR